MQRANQLSGLLRCFCRPEEVPALHIAAAEPLSSPPRSPEPARTYILQRRAEVKAGRSPAIVSSSPLAANSPPPAARSKTVGDSPFAVGDSPWPPAAVPTPPVAGGVVAAAEPEHRCSNGIERASGSSATREQRISSGASALPLRRINSGRGVAVDSRERTPSGARTAEVLPRVGAPAEASIAEGATKEEEECSDEAPPFIERSLTLPNLSRAAPKSSIEVLFGPHVYQAATVVGAHGVRTL